MGKNKIGRDAVVLTVAKILTLMISLLSSMLLSRFRTVEEYGTYSQLTLVINLITAFLLFGLPNSVNYFLPLAEDSRERKHFLSVYYSLNTIICLVCGVLLVCAVPLIEGYFNNESIRSFAYFLALYPWAYVTISGISNVLVVYGKTKCLMLLNVLTSLVALLSILVIQLCGLSFGEYMIAFLLGNLAITVAIHIIVYRLERGLRFTLDKQLLKNIFKYSVPIGIATLVGTVNVELDKLIIGNLMGTEELAYYTNAGKELPLTFVAASFTAVLMPQMVRLLKKKENEKAVKLWGVSIEISYLFICFFVAACIAFAPQIMTILYSEKYLPGVQVFRIYSLVLLLRVTYFGMVLNSVGKTKFIFWSSVLSLGLNVALNYLLYLLLGFVGPAIATLLSITLVNLAQLIFTSRILQVPFRRIFPWKKLLLYTLLNAAWGIGAYALVRALGLTTGAGDIMLCILMGAVISILYCIGFFKRAKALWNNLNVQVPAGSEEVQAQS